MVKELSIDKKLELLEKANWNYKDIADYFGCGITKASEIKRKARIYNGGFPKYMKDDEIYMMDDNYYNYTGFGLKIIINPFDDCYHR